MNKHVRLKTLVDFTLHYYHVFIVIAALLGILSIFILSGMRTNFSIKAFDLPKNQADQKLKEYNRLFSKPETETLMLIVPLPGGLNAQNFQSVLRFCSALKNIQGPKDWLTLAEMPITHETIAGEAEITSLDDLLRQTGYQKALSALLASPMITRFYNAQAQRLYVYLTVPFHTGYEPGHRRLCSTITNLTAQYLHSTVQYVGFPSLLFTLKAMFYKESILFFGLYLLLFIVLFYLHFPHLKLILFALTIITFSTIGSLAILVLAGLQLNFFGGLTFLLIYISCSSDIFHLLKKYRQAQEQDDLSLRVSLAATDTIPKSFLTSFSTAIGFGLLCFTQTPGLVNFGAYTAIGVMLAFAVTLFLAPPLLKAFLRLSRQLHDGIIVSPIAKMATKTYTIISRFPFTIIVITGILAIASIFVVFTAHGLGLSSYIEIRPHHPEARLFSQIEKEQGGLMPFYIYFHIPQKSNINSQNRTSLLLKTTFAMEQDLARRYPYATIDGLYTTLKLLSQEELDFEEFETLATDLITSEPTRIKRYYHSPTGICRVIFRVKNEDIQKFISHKKQFLKLFPYHFSCQTFVYSDAFKLYDSNIHIANNFQSSILLGLICFSAILGIICRSWLVFFVSVYVNILPLLITYAIAILFRIPMHVMVVAGFCVALGIILDDTIYVMMDGYNKMKKKIETSFHSLYLKLFPPLAAVAMFILSGAALFSFSNYTGIYYFGIIMVLNIFIGFLFDIFVSTTFVYLRFKKEEVKH